MSVCYTVFASSEWRTDKGKQMKQSKVSEAYSRSKIAREALFDMSARSMECTEDKAGIVWERFLLQTNHPTSASPELVSVVLVATPHWWDVFVPLTRLQENTEVVAAIKALRTETLAQSMAKELAA